MKIKLSLRPFLCLSALAFFPMASLQAQDQKEQTDDKPQKTESAEADKEAKEASQKKETKAEKKVEKKAQAKKEQPETKKAKPAQKKGQKKQEKKISRHRAMHLLSAADHLEAAGAVEEAKSIRQHVGNMPKETRKKDQPKEKDPTAKQTKPKKLKGQKGAVMDCCVPTSRAAMLGGKSSQKCEKCASMKAELQEVNETLNKILEKLQ
jgi:hypothetical protein